MADEIETQLRALMDKAPLTPTPDEEAAGQIEQEQGAQEAPDANAAGSVSDVQPAEASASEASKPQQAATPEPSEEAKKHIDNMKAQAREEREKRRAETAAREAAEQRAANLEMQMRQLMTQMQAHQNKAPDPEVDVVGALKYTQAQLAAAQQAQAAEAQQRAMLAQQNQIATTIRTKVEDFEAEFKAENPDYDLALDYVLDTKEAEFEAVGFSKEAAKTAAGQWAMNAAAMALRQGKNPAEAGYTLAKRMGFAVKAAPVTPQPDPAQQAAQAGAQKLQQIKDGQAAGSKMSGGGNSSNFDGSLKAGVALEGAAFDAWAEKFLRQQTRG